MISRPASLAGLIGAEAAASEPPPYPSPRGLAQHFPCQAAAERRPSGAMPPPGATTDARPVAAIFRSPLFNASETFVQTHALSLRRYRPLVVGLERKGDVQPA